MTAKTILAALALATAAASPASAGSDSTHTGDCYFDAVAVPTGRVGEPETYTMRLGVDTLVVSPSSGPAGATVTCTVSAGFGATYEATFSGTGVVSGAEWFEFTAGDPYDVWLCTTVDYADDTPTDSFCPEKTSVEFPPPAFWEAAYGAVSQVPGGAQAVCDAARLADAALPDVFGVFSIMDDGRLMIGSQSNGWATCAT